MLLVADGEAALDESRQLDFVEQGGLGAITLRAIARDMGMTANAVYSYFPTRDDLITALINDLYADLTDPVEAAWTSDHHALTQVNVESAPASAHSRRMTGVGWERGLARRSSDRRACNRCLLEARVDRLGLECEDREHGLVHAPEWFTRDETVECLQPQCILPQCH